MHMPSMEMRDSEMVVVVVVVVVVVDFNFFKIFF